MTALRRWLQGRNLGDWLLLLITAAELGHLLWDKLDTLDVAQLVYLAQHCVVIFVALARPAPLRSDHRPLTTVVCVFSYAYGFILVEAWSWGPLWKWQPELGQIVVTVATVFAFVSLLTLGRSFGIRPALRRLVTRGPYQWVRHPIYLSYLVADIGLACVGYNLPFLIVTLAGWASLVWRIELEEGVLQNAPEWQAFSERTRYRLVPGLY